MDIGNARRQYQAMQEMIRRARIERDVALGDAIGKACAMAWRAITAMRQGEKA